MSMLASAAAAFTGITLALSAALKVLDRGSSRAYGQLSHPLVRWISALAEAIVCVAVVLLPRAGLVAASVLLGAFLVIATRSRDGEPCNCFGTRLRFGDSRRARVWRNASLLAVSTIAAILSGAVELQPQRLDAIAAALGGVGVLLAADLFANSIPRDMVARRMEA